MTSALQGMDTIPKEVIKDFGDLFKDYLPGWSIDGIYNFQAGAKYQAAAAQLNLLMHNLAHPWINETLNSLLMDLAVNKEYAGKQTQYLAALVNFMYEANGKHKQTAKNSKNSSLSSRYFIDYFSGFTYFVFQ